MGLFDSVMVDCPTCGESIEHQSKGAEAPMMEVYTLESAPMEVLLDVLNEPRYCMKCGNWHVLYDPRFPPERPVPDVRPTVRRVRAPRDNGEYMIYSGLPGDRWWNTTFSQSDMLPEDSDDA